MTHIHFEIAENDKAVTESGDFKATKKMLENAGNKVTTSFDTRGGEIITQKQAEFFRAEIMVVLVSSDFFASDQWDKVARRAQDPSQITLFAPYRPSSALDPRDLPYYFGSVVPEILPILIQKDKDQAWRTIKDAVLSKLSTRQVAPPMPVMPPLPPVQPPAAPIQRQPQVAPKPVIPPTPPAQPWGPAWMHSPAPTPAQAWTPAPAQPQVPSSRGAHAPVSGPAASSAPGETLAKKGLLDRFLDKLVEAGLPEGVVKIFDSLKGIPEARIFSLLASSVDSESLENMGIHRSFHTKIAQAFQDVQRSPTQTSAPATPARSQASRAPAASPPSTLGMSADQIEAERIMRVIESESGTIEVLRINLRGTELDKCRDGKAIVKELLKYNHENGSETAYMLAFPAHKALFQALTGRGYFISFERAGHGGEVILMCKKGNLKKEMALKIPDEFYAVGENGVPKKLAIKYLTTKKERELADDLNKHLAVAKRDLGPMVEAEVIEVDDLDVAKLQAAGGVEQFLTGMTGDPGKEEYALIVPVITPNLTSKMAELGLDLAETFSSMREKVRVTPLIGKATAHYADAMPATEALAKLPRIGADIESKKNKDSALSSIASELRHVIYRNFCAVPQSLLDTKYQVHPET